MTTEEIEFDELREGILEKIDLTREMDDEEIANLIAVHVDAYAHRRLLTLVQRENLEQSLFHSLRKLDVLQELLEDEEITEIMVNGADMIFYE